MRFCGMTLPGNGLRQYVEELLPEHGSVATAPLPGVQLRVVMGSYTVIPYWLKCCPSRSAIGGVTTLIGNGTSSCQPSKLRNTKSLSLRTGPPSTPPN